ncbi:hypothetical protein [Neorhodopirellula pilleata]|uniref:Shikimate 5-dehydrogenase n=1 Tax=Neorhodopirellula pilleata TaxID=2714738 RepID=A0A5C5ZF74_9BACT|nr:hypothetical protein [Neorhodopirellula pilleata]TWT86099.1 hypothetical protein Pla100_61930 [Neorhodopirellula pilleata]
MDETTEPIIAVIGHPIAGNPTQFALETGLQAAGVDCRVFSVDLSPDKIEPALVGMFAMNFKAVWVASSCRPTIEQASEETDTNIDLLVRTPSQEAHADPITYSGWYLESLKMKTTAAFIHEASQKSHLAKVIFVNEGLEPQESSTDAHTEAHAEAIKQRLSWLNRYNAAHPVKLEDADVVLLNQAPSSAEIAALQDDLGEDQSWLMIIEQRQGKGTAVRFDFEIPARQTLIDLNEECDSQYVVALDRLKASSPGDVIRCVDLHARCLSALVAQLFGKTAPVEVFQEAIDEYLAV